MTDSADPTAHAKLSERLRDCADSFTNLMHPDYLAAIREAADSLAAAPGLVPLPEKMVPSWNKVSEKMRSDFMRHAGMRAGGAECLWDFFHQNFGNVCPRCKGGGEHFEDGRRQACHDCQGTGEPPKHLATPAPLAAQSHDRTTVEIARELVDEIADKWHYDPAETAREFAAKDISDALMHERTVTQAANMSIFQQWALKIAELVAANNRIAELETELAEHRDAKEVFSEIAVDVQSHDQAIVRAAEAWRATRQEGFTLQSQALIAAIDAKRAAQSPPPREKCFDCNGVGTTFVTACPEPSVPDQAVGCQTCQGTGFIDRCVPRGERIERSGRDRRSFQDTGPGWQPKRTKCEDRRAQPQSGEDECTCGHLRHVHGTDPYNDRQTRCATEGCPCIKFNLRIVSDGGE